MAIRCYQCKGLKSYMGLGMMKQKCNVCHGVGYLKEDKKEEVTVDLPNEKKLEISNEHVLEEPVKRKGRPPKKT